MSVLIKGGRVVTAADDYVGDIYVEDERITLIGESLDVQADKVIDASGKYVLPGCIDPHTHLDMPFGGTITADDFESGHISAAFGGTTTHVDFCLQGRDNRSPKRSRPGTARRTARRSSTTASTSPSPTSRRAGRSRTWRASPTRASRPTSCSWPTRARSWSTTRRSSASCRSRPTPARS